MESKSYADSSDNDIFAHISYSTWSIYQFLKKEEDSVVLTSWNESTYFQDILSSAISLSKGSIGKAVTLHDGLHAWVGCRLHGSGRAKRRQMPARLLPAVRRWSMHVSDVCPSSQQMAGSGPSSLQWIRKVVDQGAVCACMFARGRPRAALPRVPCQDWTDRAPPDRNGVAGDPLLRSDTAGLPCKRNRSSWARHSICVRACGECVVVGTRKACQAVRVVCLFFCRSRTQRTTDRGDRWASSSQFLLQILLCFYYSCIVRFFLVQIWNKF
jgi:hypothetical protein